MAAQEQRGKQQRERDNAAQRLTRNAMTTAQDSAYAIAGVGGYLADGVRNVNQTPEAIRKVRRGILDARGRLAERGRSVVGRLERRPIHILIDLTDLEGMTVQELRELAKDRDIEGRSQMTKEELVHSLAMSSS